MVAALRRRGFEQGQGELVEPGNSLNLLPRVLCATSARNPETMLTSSDRSCACPASQEGASEGETEHGGRVSLIKGRIGKKTGGPTLNRTPHVLCTYRSDCKISTERRDVSPILLCAAGADPFRALIRLCLSRQLAVCALCCCPLVVPFDCRPRAEQSASCAIMAPNTMGLSCASMHVFFCVNVCIM